VLQNAPELISLPSLSPSLTLSFALNPGSCFGFYDFFHDLQSATTWTMAANRKSRP